MDRFTRHILRYNEKRNMAIATLELHRMSIDISSSNENDNENETIKRLMEYIKYLDSEFENWQQNNLHGNFAN